MKQPQTKNKECKTYKDKYGFTVHEPGKDCPHIIGSVGLTKNTECIKCKLAFPEAWGLEQHTCGKNTKAGEGWRERFEKEFGQILGSMELTYRVHGGESWEGRKIIDFIQTELDRAYKEGALWAVNLISKKEGWEDSRDFYRIIVNDALTKGKEE